MYGRHDFHDDDDFDFDHVWNQLDKDIDHSFTSHSHDGGMGRFSMGGLAGGLVAIGVLICLIAVCCCRRRSRGAVLSPPPVVPPVPPGPNNPQPVAYPQQQYAPYPVAAAPYPAVTPYPTASPYPAAGGPYPPAGYPGGPAPYPQYGAPYPTATAPYPAPSAPHDFDHQHAAPPPPYDQVMGGKQLPG